MTSKQMVSDTILRQGILPLYFFPDETVSTEVLRAIYRAGIKAVEYTNRGEEASRNFKRMVEVKNRELPGMLLGVGTIKTPADAENYTSAGADFLVSPGLIPAVVDFANSKDLFYAPGCMTPSEIIAAENSGIQFIKLFPGNLLGPGFVSTIKEIFPKLLFMPTGGVDTTVGNLEAWFKAGVCAVGMGSKLISKKLMEQKDYNEIERLTLGVLNVIQQIKGNS